MIIDHKSHTYLGTPPDTSHFNELNCICSGESVVTVSTSQNKLQLLCPGTSHHI